jgi:hypothetical protein
VIDPNHGLSLTRRVQLLDLPRASLYYEPVRVCEADLHLMCAASKAPPSGAST